MPMINFSKTRQEKGRELEPSVAILTGEGADQKVRNVVDSRPVPVWETVPSHREREPADYYRLPMVKEPVWTWTVPLYFYTGGLAGGGGVLAAVLQAKKRGGRLARICRWLSFGAVSLSGVLLTYDLGKPQRFLNMLRVFRPTSPMSWGSWALAETGALAGTAALFAECEGTAGKAGRFATLTLATHGVFLAGYTGVLLGNTATPLWKHSRWSLPFLFHASAVASTAAFLEFLPLRGEEERVVHRFGMVGKLSEAAGMLMLEAEVAKVPEAARPLKEGKSGMLWKGAKACLLGGIVLSLLPGKSQVKRRVSAGLTTAGAILMRFALMEAGKASALNPQAVITAQRSNSPEPSRTQLPT